ncbi:MAG: hypothetical protein O7D33_06690, partial [Chloroflexi bacterium]|nr:hypothetical protein [Chloroflexota bacterium]
MTPTIRIDEQVMEELMKRAVDLGMVFPTPNEVLREILELSKGGIFPSRPVLSTASEEKDFHLQYPSSKVSEIQQILDAMQPALTVLSTNGFYYDTTRKWVAYPDNFVTIRTQEARKKDIAITMYGKPLDFEGLQPSLQIKGDRPSYSRFNIS